MNFELTDKQKLVRSGVRKFAESVLAPVAPIIDKEQRFSWETARELSKINAWGIQLPEKYGGAELDSISYIISIEEFARVCASTALNLTVHNSVGAYPIYTWGSEEQKERFLYDIASGKKIAGFTWTEPNAGSDAAGIECMAVQDGNDFVLNGSKIFVTNGGIGSVFLVGSKYITSKGDKGIGVFIVEKEMKGFEISKTEDKLNMRGSNTTSLYFNNVSIPKENILGKLTDGFRIAMQTLDVGRIGIAALALGIAQAAYEHSIDYSKGRLQFKKPISEFQAIAFKLADMATEIEAARLLTYKAAFMKDQKLRFSKEAAMCKLYAGQISTRIVEQAVLIHGGYGCMKDLPVERYYRDAIANQIMEGTSDIMKLIISQQILRGNI